MAELGVREGEAVERAAQQHGRKQVPDGQDEIQVGDRLLGPGPVRRERGQRQPAEVLRQAHVGRRRPVQLGQRIVGSADVFAQPRLEEPGQGKRRRRVRLSVGQSREESVPLVVRAGRREPAG